MAIFKIAALSLETHLNQLVLNLEDFLLQSVVILSLSSQYDKQAIFADNVNMSCQAYTPYILIGHDSGNICWVIKYSY